MDTPSRRRQRRTRTLSGRRQPRAPTEEEAVAHEPLNIHLSTALRNPLLELRPWILDLVFGNFGGLFWLILAHPGASRPQKSIPVGLTDLRARNESSGARLGLYFWSFSREV